MHRQEAHRSRTRRERGTEACGIRWATPLGTHEHVCADHPVPAGVKVAWSMHACHDCGLLHDAQARPEPDPDQCGARLWAAGAQYECALLSDEHTEHHVTVYDPDADAAGGVVRLTWSGEPMRAPEEMLPALPCPAEAAQYRTDALPTGWGPCIIQDGAYRQWVITRDWIYQIGGGLGRRHSDQMRRIIGPWRYVAIPLPDDIQRAQTNHHSPSTRRTFYGGPVAEPLTEHEHLTLDELDQGVNT